MEFRYWAGGQENSVEMKSKSVAVALGLLECGVGILSIRVDGVGKVFN